jgi:hypothetical protein
MRALTNIYEDISDNLSAKPFAKECELDDKEPDDLKKLSENIDGQGHNLHVFAKDVFKSGLDKGVGWILVDYTKVPPGVTLAAERAGRPALLGAHPGGANAGGLQRLCERAGDHLPRPHL